jgi:DNA-binding NtrC family response regulator
MKSLETPAQNAGAFATHGKATRKRTYVHSSPVSRIFVVDDEPVIASSLAAILQMNGFAAKFFTCPLEALAAARSESPDLVISDVAMPGISGIDLAIQMRAQYPNCKILLFSGQAATSDLLESARAQGYDFRLLQKPVHPSEFLSEVGRLSMGLLQAAPPGEILMPATT